MSRPASRVLAMLEPPRPTDRAETAIPVLRTLSDAARDRRTAHITHRDGHGGVSRRHAASGTGRPEELRHEMGRHAGRLAAQAARTRLSADD